MIKRIYTWEGVFGTIKYKAYPVIIPFMFFAEALLCFIWCVLSVPALIFQHVSRLNLQDKKK